MEYAAWDMRRAGRRWTREEVEHCLYILRTSWRPQPHTPGGCAPGSVVAQ